MSPRFAPERLLPFAAIVGALLLIGSQFLDIFELRSAGEVVQATVGASDQHWYSMALLGLFAVFAVAGSIAAGSKPLAIAATAAGVVALLLFLLIDLPDAGRADSVATSAEGLVTAEAHPAGGFWVELVGALVLTMCAGALATLTPTQLRSLRPGASERSRAELPSRQPVAANPKASPKPKPEPPARAAPKKKSPPQAAKKAPPSGARKASAKSKKGEKPDEAADPDAEREARRAEREAKRASSTPADDEAKSKTAKSEKQAAEKN